MHKQEFLIEAIIQDVVFLIIQNKKMDWDEAMKVFYQSETFDKLCDTETGMYLESSAYIYELFMDEIKYGKFGHFAA